MVAIQQALHGYDGGHRLLSSSIEVGTSSGRLMTIASDLSGPSADGFTSYLTGYPLSEEGFYVLARTWSASEMERPGCVWTHSLLIRTVDLAGIAELACLLPLLRRPTLRSVGDYGARLELSVTGVAGQATPDARRLRCLLAALYGSPDVGLLVPAEDSGAYEAEVMAIWSQQWPRLRRGFVFSTGSLSERGESTGLSFDLQVVPRSRTRSVANVGGFRLVGCHTDEASPEAVWLQQESETVDAGFRVYLNRVGSDAGGRDAMCKLIHVFSLLGRRVPVARLAEEVRGLFEEDSATLLRAVLFGPVSRTIGCAAWIDERARLEHLTTTPEPADYRVSEAELRARAVDLQATDRDAARELTARLLRIDLNPRGATLLGALSDSWQIEDIVAVEARQPGAAAAIVLETPAFACEPALWSCLPDNHDGLVDALASASSMSRQIARRILQATIDSGRPPPPGLVAACGASFVAALLDLSGEMEAQTLRRAVPSAWLAAFIGYPDACVAWLVDSEAPVAPAQALLLSAGLFGARHEQLAGITVRTWMSRFPATVEGLERLDARRVDAFLVRTAFCLPADAAEHVLEVAFHRLHNALIQSVYLDAEVWQWLSPCLPPQPRNRHWDKAERLRMGVIRLIATLDLPVELLVRLFTTEPAIRYMCETLERMEDGSRSLVALGRAIERGRCTPSAAQQRVISRAIEAHNKKARKAAKAKAKAKAKKKRKFLWW